MWSNQTLDLVALWGELFPLVCVATMSPTNPQVTHNWIGSSMNWVMLWCWMACASSCVHQTANLGHERHVVKGLETPLDRKISKEWLSQWVSFGEGLTSGGTPPGEPAFAFLAREGYRTIVSVDGARPDLKSAHRHGLTYVHLPMSYDGVDPSVALGLFRVMQQSDSPVFIHCHQGHHRGPTAAAIASMAKGLCSQEEALTRMELAGTSPAYSGLWRSVRSYQLPEKGTPMPILREAVAGNLLIEAMVTLDRVCEWLDERASFPDGAGFQSHEAACMERFVLIREGFMEAAREPDAVLPSSQADWEERFHRAQDTVEDILQSMRDRQWKGALSGYQELKRQCSQCHQTYRDE